MSAKKSPRPAPKSSAGAPGATVPDHPSSDSEQYQSARGCLTLLGIGVASLAVIILLALLLGKFN